jgi:hypothetical protein
MREDELTRSSSSNIFAICANEFATMDTTGSYPAEPATAPIRDVHAVWKALVCFAPSGG